MGTATNRNLAIVTGASSGIGFELAKQCVAHDMDLVICAEDEGIHQAAVHLGAAGTSVVPVCADLATHEGVETLVQAIRSTARPVDALVMNAGVGVGGGFILTDLEEELRMIALNCTSLIHLGKRVIPGMVSRGQGRVLITASIASTSPAPFLAVYGATKAFALSFAEALRHELKDTGVTVTALQPGATDTEFFARAHMENTKVAQGKKDDPAEVAKMGFEAMMAGKDSVIAASLKSKIMGLANEVLPETLKAKAQARETRPGTGEKPTNPNLRKQD
ncbi:MAG TPA: SDR family NAD(P)-dependent oxidoreductase [Kofleriaceae bacterium]